MSLVISLLKSFFLTWDMLRDFINKIPDEHWKTGEIEYLVPARQMFHIIETAEFYAGKNPESFPQGGRFNINWKKATSEEFPDKNVMLEYLEDVIEKVEGWLEGHIEASILTAKNMFPWTGSAVIDRALYLLAHCRQHMGEINAELRHRDLSRVKWRAFN